MAGGPVLVILVNNTTAVTTVGDFANAGVTPANVVDTVGYGSTPTTFETAAHRRST